MRVKMYTTRWCPDCWRAKRFLKSNGIDFAEISIEDDYEAAQLVMAKNEGKQRVPTLEINGAYYGDPPLSKLAELVGVE